MDKRDLSERDICTKYITPAIQQAGWDIHTQVREELTLTAGQIIVRGRLTTRKTGKRADYVLFHKANIPIAVVEAKDNKHSLGAGMQQALDYAEMLDVPFAFSSNGDAFLMHDGTVTSGKVEREIPLEQFPSPAELWQRYRAWKAIDEGEQEAICTEDYYFDAGGKEPRYYQLNAINRAIQAIAKGQNRILLVMATGTGKTYVAFQIIYRLWKARRKKRILFLADRNILVDQTMTNDFKPFGKVMTKITKRTADAAFEVYLSLYQAITGPEERQKIFREFSPGFFDLIVIDECHRGSAAEDSAWREILEYFNEAAHIGLTATPKETKYVSNIHYFGDPVYMYSLKQGIQDGFLAPYKVVRIDLDKDLTGWRPEVGKRDKYGTEIEDRIYNQQDFDRTLVLEQRTELVATLVSDFLKQTDERYNKTIVFCEDIDHAERMRQDLVNENPDLVGKDRRYVMRITGDEQEGKKELDNFIDPESRHPVLVTTSRLLSTGVDAQTCKLIALDRRIQSMTEFKQIIGRGTRINEDFGKTYFTIMDFKMATALFADPQFDGEPVQIYEPKPGETVVPPDEPGDPPDGVEPTPGEDGGEEPGGKRPKYYVDDVGVSVAAERVQYYGKDGKLITESLKDYTQKTVREEYETLDDFLKRWTEADRKQAVVKELEERGLLLEALAEEVGKDFGPFDLICHVVYDQPPLTRRERVKNVRQRGYFAKYGETARAVLNALLDKYADAGLKDLEDVKVLQLRPMDQFGTPVEIIRSFGGKEEYIQAVRDLEDELYKVA